MLQVIEISNMSVTRDEMTLPLVSLVKKSIKLAPKAMDILGLNEVEKPRVYAIITANEDKTKPETVWIARQDDQTKGHAVNPLGTFNHITVNSYIKALAGAGKQTVFSGSTIEHNGATFHALEMYVEEVPEPIAEEVVEVEAEVEEVAVIEEQPSVGGVILNDDEAEGDVAVNEEHDGVIAFDEAVEEESDAPSL